MKSFLSRITINGVLFGLLVASVPSQASTIGSVYKTNAAGICQSSYPATAGALVRARPLAVQNEGENHAFVTCSLPTMDHDEGPNWAGMGLVFVNNSIWNVDVTCTLVRGAIRDGNVLYMPRTHSVPAGSVDVFMMFLSDELPDSPATIVSPNISCALPPGVGIQYLWYQYDREIGE